MKKPLTSDARMCCAALDAGDLSALPALADALEEAGDARAPRLRQLIADGYDPMASGLAQLDEAGVSDWLWRWQCLACRPDQSSNLMPGCGYLEESPVPAVADPNVDVAFEQLAGQIAGLSNVTEVLRWAQEVRHLARAIEGTMAPNATAQLQQPGEVCLTWDGTFTHGRFVTVQIWPGDDGRLHGMVEWNTATSRYSTFLGWPDWDALNQCSFFKPLDSEYPELLTVSDAVLGQLERKKQ